MQPKLVIFDLDGTLIDGAQACIPAMQHAFRTVNLPVPNAVQVKNMIGLSITPAIYHILSSFNDIRHVSESEVEQIGDIYKDYFYQSRIANKHQSPIYSGALKCLAKLHANPNILLSIATGKSRRGVNAFLDKYELNNLFSTSWCATECHSKPHPEMIDQAMNTLGIDAENTIMVGDTEFDMQMAKNAKVHAIGVDWGYHSQELMLKSGANQIVDNFEQLTLAIFERFKNAN
ncbi:MAG: HAD-IA family hydrolase [Rhizobiales bacterium]|nr:HAD-IA family hydrolase [Hyphomicrobiales bacterium]NRB13672.1 HAD-IA family hydrolase [Hyphomicrobiales bacterium]